VKRVRAKGDYTKQFQRVFGHEPTRDAIAKAIATYERTVLTGNSIHDRAELAMRERVADEGGNFVIAAKDYETVLKNAFDRKDANALKALGLTDATKIADAAKSINQGRVLFFNKARCNTCHAGDNFTDNQFHNLGVRVKDGKIAEPGRFGAQPTGHKNPELMGAFKTPTLRGLLSTAPYMHDGSEDTLEKVVEFYNKGGNPSAWLSSKMRDTVAEQLVNRGTSNPNAKKFDGRVIVPFQLQLTDQEKKDLVLFLRALQGDPVDPMIADPEKFPDGV
jgi:cytochrome c peroxidase